MFSLQIAGRIKQLISNLSSKEDFQASVKEIENLINMYNPNGGINMSKQPVISALLDELNFREPNTVLQQEQKVWNSYQFEPLHIHTLNILS